MKLTIRHLTQYDYSTPLQYAHQSLCLTPQTSAHQTIVDWSLRAPGPLFAERDGWGNQAHTWSLKRRLSSGAIQADGTVLTHAQPLLVDALVPPQLYLRSTDLTTPHDRLAALGAECLSGDSIDESQALSLASLVLRKIPYKPRTTTVHTTAMEALALGGGVCQDHAHVFVAACRAHGIPARYVSGYFHAVDAPHLANHAWADVCVDVASRRWLSIDITHGCLMDERHVRLAVGPDYAACSPIRGIREGGGRETMRVSIHINEAVPA